MQPSEERIVDGVLAGSRAMVALAVRSLSGLAEDITIAQYRTLVVLASRGPQKLSDLAGHLDVTPSTAGRMCERLVHRGLASRHRAHDDRRVVRISLTADGRRVVDEATRQRREVIGTILGALTPEHRAEIADALRDFAAAAGEIPDSEWPQGPVETAARI